MNNRYIQRFRMPDRQYVAGSPVVLAAGVLLEDTEKRRLVVQLKWKNISEKTIAKVAVYVKALDENGKELCKVKHTHRVRSARRGAIFGHYDAIELPVADAKSFELELIGTVATDAEVWRNTSGVWVTLPAFTELTLDEETQSFFNRYIGNGKYEYYKADDVWYCTCGAVNKAGETKCHKCRNLHEIVAKYADPASLAAALQAKKDAEQKRQEDIEKFKAEAGAKLNAFKEAAEKKAIDVAASIELAKEEKARAKAEREAAAAAEATDIGQVPVVSVEPSKKMKKVKPAKSSKKSGKWILIRTAVVAVALIAIFVIPKIAGGIGGNLPGRVNVNVTTDYDGETYQMVLETDSDGTGWINLDLIKDYIPEAESFVMDGTPYLGDELEYYLKTSTYMAELAASKGEFAYGYGSFNFNPSWENGIFYLIAFDDLTNVCGYGVGHFENLGNGEWGFDITECDYDISEIYDGASLMLRGIQNTVPELGPEAIYDDDVAYYIRGFDYSTNSEVYNNVQKYNLWSRYMTTNLDFYRDADTIESSLPEDNRDYPVWTYYLLIDEEYQIIGFSCYTTYDPSATGTYSIETSYDTEMIEYRVPVEDNAMRIRLADIQEAMPWADIYTMEFLNIPAVKTDIDDYIKISRYAMNYVSNGGRISNSVQGEASMSTNSEAYALLLYSDDMRLVGYSIGVPDMTQTSEMPIQITLCDYDLSELLAKTYEEFIAEGFYGNIGYIPLEILEESGEEPYVLSGLNSGSNDSEWVSIINEYYLWSRVNFPEYLEYGSGTFDSISYYNTTNSEIHFLLLDDNYNIVGYTIKH